MRTPFRLTRLIVQLRLAKNYRIVIPCNENVYCLDPSQTCSICNLQEPESLNHISFHCPIYNDMQPHYSSPDADKNVSNLLLSVDKTLMKKRLMMLSNYLKIRAFCLNK